MKKIRVSNTVRRFLPALLAALLCAACPQPSDSDNNNNQDTEYSVSVESLTNGEVSVSPESAKAGATITVTVSPNDYFEMNGPPLINNENGTTKTGDTTFTFSMPAKNVTVTVPALKLQTGYIAINTPADLAKIGNDLDHPPNGTYVLLDDITLDDWEPVSLQADTNAAPKFHGNNKTIRVTSFHDDALSLASLGIFSLIQGMASDWALADNLTLVWDSEDPVNPTTAMSSVLQGFGIFAGVVKFAEINNVKISGALEIDDGSAALLVGSVFGTANSCILERVCSSVTITVGARTGSGYCGGIAGQVRNESLVQNCGYTGDITTTGSNVEIGGIAGNVIGTSNEDIAQIRGCPVSGNITRSNFTVSSSGGGAYTGGIVSRMQYAAISASSFTGTIQADMHSSQTGYTIMIGLGGIAGTSRQSTSNRITDCYVRGTISGRETKAGSSDTIGGIVGYAYSDTITITRCYAAGKILAASTGVSTNNRIYSAGILGYYATAPVIENCAALQEEITYTVDSGASMQTNLRMNRIACNSGSVALGGTEKNIAWQDMPVQLFKGATNDTGNNTTKINYDKTPRGQDGEDTAAATPAQSVYEDMGWDFTTVWTMGGDGYPVLK
jgi:hypothetical protein